MGPLQGQRTMLGGPEFVFWEILANGAGQKKDKKLESDSLIYVFLKTKIFRALRVSIKAFTMIRDHSLVLESVRETKMKILKAVFQEMRTSKFLDSPHRLCKILYIALKL